MKNIEQTKKSKEISVIPLKSYSPDEVVKLDLSLITPSPFEPQQRRRNKFNDSDLESLGGSIERHGLAQPIVVRPVSKPEPFEIVFGERRYLASKVKNLQTIGCFVRELSDAQVLELQYEENHRRVDNDPLDDAFFFKFLKEKEGYTDDELADRLNTTRKNVADKLKLNDLIAEAAAELEDGDLPLRHAYYLSRYPPTAQKQIVEAGYAYKYNDRDEKPTSYQDFKWQVEQNILRNLATAPFDTDDPRLHVRGLVCGDCPERTGYDGQLFPELAADDSCLNKSCFGVKTNTHLRIQRDAIALAQPNPESVPIQEIAQNVPLVTDKDWADETPFREKPQTKQIFLPEPECEFSTLSLIVDGLRKGEQTYTCQSKSCEFHNPTPAPKVLDENQLQQKEIEFERQVDALTREKVFSEALSFFTDYKPFWLFDDLIQKLIAAFWWASPAECKDFVCRSIKGWTDAPTSRSHYWDIERFVKNLDKAGQSKILFLLTHADFQETKNTGEKICADYAKSKYALLDAESRLELAPDEFKPIADFYLQQIRSGHREQIPRFWLPTEPNDPEPDDAGEVAPQNEVSQSIH